MDGTPEKPASSAPPRLARNRFAKRGNHAGISATVCDLFCGKTENENAPLSRFASRERGSGTGRKEIGHNPRRECWPFSSALSSPGGRGGSTGFRLLVRPIAFRRELPHAAQELQLVIEFTRVGYGPGHFLP
jgi:hypothetical protein